MTWTLNALLCFGSLATAAVLDRRQATNSIHSVGPDGKKQVFGYNFDLERLSPPVAPVKMVEEKARFRSNALRKVTRFGPFTLPPLKDGVVISNHTHGGSAKSPTDAPKTLADWIPGMQAITWEDLAKSYRLASQGQYEDAMRNMMMIPLDQGANIFQHSLKGGFCTDCTVLAIKTDLVYEDGTRVDISNGVYVHHAVTMNMAWKKMSNWINLCPIESGVFKGYDFFSKLPTSFDTPFTLFGNGAVDEFQQWYASPTAGGVDSGFYLGADDYHMLQAEVVNYTKDEKKIFIDFDFEYLPGKVGKESTMAIISTNGCFDGLGFYGQGGTGVIKSPEFTVLQPGTIVVARGHLHDGGDSMTVYVNGKNVCVSKAIYGTKMKNESGKEWTTISRMTDCTDAVHVAKGDKIKVETKFDEVAHPPRETKGKTMEEMGVMQFTFVPE